MSEIKENISAESQIPFANAVQSVYDVAYGNMDGSTVYTKPFGSDNNHGNDKADIVEEKLDEQYAEKENSDNRYAVRENENTEEIVSGQVFDGHTEPQNPDDAAEAADDGSQEAVSANNFGNSYDLESLVKAGSDDPFNMKAEDYESDHDLEALVKSGSDDPFNMKAEDYESDHDLEALVKSGSDDPFNMKAEDYESDHDLEALIRKGSDDPFNADTNDYEVDPQLAALIRNGSENSPLGNLEELPKDEEQEEQYEQY